MHKQIILMGLVLFSFVGCKTTEPKDAVKLRTIKQCTLTAQGPDAISQAERWAQNLTKQTLTEPVKALTTNWKDAQVVRVWQVDGTKWKAMIASKIQPDATDDVVILEMTSDKNYQVQKSSVGKARQLWPTLD